MDEIAKTSEIAAADKETELCTIDGKIYVAAEIKGEIFLAEKTDKGVVKVSGETHTAKELGDLKRKIKAVTPEVRTINAEVKSKIRERYSVEDEIKMLRTSPSQESSEWNDYVEDCIAWGRAEKAKLGL